MPKRSISKTPSLPSNNKYWKIKEAYCAPDCGYKNEIIATLQQKIIHREPGMPMSDVKKFVMQAYQENGSFNIWATGGTDKGRSYGIGQWNVGNAKKYLADNCAKNEAGECDYDLELERQLKLLADDMVASYRQYKGDVRLAVIAHNRPKSASEGKDQCLAGPTDGNDPGINDCYYAEQVMRHENSLEI